MPSFLRLFNEVIRGLRRQPAYLLVFSLALIVSGYLGPLLIKQTPILAVAAMALPVLLAGLVVFLVERRSVVLDSVEDRETLSELHDERKAIREVLGGAVENERTTYFVYSELLANGLTTLDKKPINYPYSPDDYRVTTLFDARGIAEIHAMLNIAGKHERLHQITAMNFTDDHWNHNLILLGSRYANPTSDYALNSFNSPYRFAADLLSIERADDSSISWPSDRQELHDRDFGLLIKLKRVPTGGGSTVYFVIAGVGPLGTQATCYFFRKQILPLQAKFHDGPFACVLSVRRQLGYTSVAEIESEAIALITS